MGNKEPDQRGFGSRKRIDAIRSIPCLVCRQTPSENAHVRSRGAGGDKEDIGPLCNEHHRELHQIGIETFQVKHEIDLAAEAARLAAILDGLY